MNQICFLCVISNATVMKIFKPLLMSFVLLVLVASKCKEEQQLVWADNFIEDELIVKIKEKASMEEIVAEFKDYDAVNRGILSATGRTYLIKFNTDKISSEEMYYKMVGHKDVEAVEFNKTVQDRQ